MEALPALSLFEGLSRKQLARIARVSDDLEVAAGTVLCRGGQSRKKEYFVIISGEAGPRSPHAPSRPSGAAISSARCAARAGQADRDGQGDDAVELLRHQGRRVRRRRQRDGPDDRACAAAGAREAFAVADGGPGDGLTDVARRAAGPPACVACCGSATVRGPSRTASTDPRTAGHDDDALAAAAVTAAGPGSHVGIRCDAYRQGSMPAALIASLVEGEAVLRFPFDERLRQLLRAIPGRRWDPEERVWRCAARPGAGRGADAFLRARAVPRARQRRARSSPCTPAREAPPRGVGASRRVAPINAEDTRDWTQIAALYDELARLAPSPVIELNRAVALAEARGPAVGLASIEALDGLDGYHYFHAARAELLRRLDRWAEARVAFEQALQLVRSEPERRFLQSRLASL